MGLKWGVFGKFGYPGLQERHLPAFIGYFKQQNELWFLAISVFAKKSYNFYIFRNFSSKHFWKYLKTFTFSKKTMNRCFVANLPSFQENFKLLKSVACSQSYMLKKPSLIFFRSVFTYHKYINVKYSHSRLCYDTFSGCYYSSVFFFRFWGQ